MFICSTLWDSTGQHIQLSSGAAAELQGRELRESKVFAEVGCAGDMGVNWEC